MDAWFTKPSVYAVAAKTANHIAAALNFARENNLRLGVKGGGHSYQGTSNAPDSLLVWTRRMNEITLHDRFVPRGCERMHAPQRAVSCCSGASWVQAYDAVTTKAGAYVQGGGCTTVGVAGLDLQMPVLDGVNATRRLHEEVFDGLRAGALGYLLKDAPSEKLGEAIRLAARGESFLQPSVAAKVIAEFARVTNRSAVNSQP